MDSKNTSKFFKRVGSIHCFENNEASRGGSSYEALTEEEYEAVSLINLKLFWWLQKTFFGEIIIDVHVLSDVLEAIFWYILLGEAAAVVFIL